jgi:hypothetical protein
MALNASGPISLAGATAGQSIAVELSLGTTTQISLNDTAVRTLAGVASGAITMPTNFWGKSNTRITQKAIFGYGSSTGVLSTTNLVSNTGVVAGDTSGLGTARYQLAAAGYGSDKAIFGYGSTSTAANSLSITNLVSNTGVVATDTSATGTTARSQLAAVAYGGDKGIFAYGYTTVATSVSNYISNTGVVGANTAGVGTARLSLAAAIYGGDKGIFGYGRTNTSTANVTITNLVSNSGVIAADVTSPGTARNQIAAAGYSST